MHWPGSVRRTHLFSHSLSLSSLSASRSLTRPEPRSAQGSRAARKSCTGFLLQTNCFGKCVCSLKPTSLWNPVLEAQHPGTGAASTSRTIHNLGNNSGGHRQRGAQTRCLRGVWGL